MFVKTYYKKRYLSLIAILYSSIFYLCLAVASYLTIYGSRKFQEWKANQKRNENDAYPAADSTCQNPQKTKRLASLDTFRGLSIVVMIFVNGGGGGYWFFQHATWDGLLVADLVFPWFIWIMGVCIPMAITGQLKRKEAEWTVFKGILRRSATLFFIGACLGSRGQPIETLRIPGVLQRFAVCYLFSATLVLFSLRLMHQKEPEGASVLKLTDVSNAWPHWVAILVLLAIHTGLTFGLPVPGCPTGYLGPGGLHDNASYPDFCIGGATGYIDKILLTESHIYKFPTAREVYKSGSFDPEGILGSVTSIIQTLLGVQTGITILTFKDKKRRLASWLSFAILFGLLGGALCNFTQFGGIIPVNKNLWSISYVLVTTCFALIILSVFYLLIDVYNIWNGAPLVFPGKHVLQHYMMERPNKKVLVELMKKDAKEFKESPKNANKLLSMQQKTEDEDKHIVLAAIKQIQNMTVHLLKQGYMVKEKTDSEAEEKYKSWLLERYREIVDSRLKQVASDDFDVFQANLRCLMDFLRHESLYPIHLSEDNGFHFPIDIINGILKVLLSTIEDKKEAISRFQEFVEYEDVKHYVLKCLNDLLKDMTAENYEPSEMFIKNLLGVLKFIHMRPIHGKKRHNEHEEFKLFCVDTDPAKPKFHMKMNQLRKYYTNIWLIIIKFNLSISIYKNLLTLVSEEVLPAVDKPLLFADFFLEAYDKGGPISLLALNGVFQLIHKFNLEYPDFYKKLYSLFVPDVFHAKYRARFFFLADIFMSSTYLSEYLAAAFVKRTSRLCLSAPPTGIRIALQFIGNIMYRHPGLKKMMHCPEDQTELGSDPYIMEERDPAKCRAIESSLWEVKTLQSHLIPKIADEAKFINKDLPKVEWFLGDILENTLEEVTYIIILNYGFTTRYSSRTGF
ncbi:hypothetical protein QYM36_003004 [Artemia franciscana]|uniref:CCAAT-binding factor domain-containing protein n=1 Tax=Artemia franciscana TaxID=6661 RepID=A0AA88IKS8_ARTSF|nr:hypothetical protein QYM36_003004 [Artemia franciscana]